MDELGKTFQKARETKNITLDQVTQATKIKRVYLEAIETENFKVFPSVPMLRGFIRNYAIFLGLDSAQMLSLYEQPQGGGKRQLKDIQGIEFMNLAMVRGRPRFTIDGFITILMIFTLLGSVFLFIQTQYLQPATDQLAFFDSATVIESLSSSDQTSTAIRLPTPTFAPTPTPTPTATSTPTPQYYTGVSIELNVVEASWVRILVDEQQVFEGLLEVGQRPHWTGEKQVAIRAGNGGGIEIFVNGQNMGLMGEPGQVIDQVWEKVETATDIESINTLTPTPNHN